MKETDIEDDPNTSPQLTEFFSKSECVFNTDSTKKHDNTIATALKNTKHMNPISITSIILH